MPHQFTSLIEQWYALNMRSLPWRQTRDPYRIWLSEIILQQTRVEQGMDYYHRFLKVFPTVHHLAQAPEDEVLRLWQGLGYYSRARNLHKAALQIDSMPAFPTDYTSVLSLPGVGSYTAAAICSFAYDLPYAVLDGNVFRVLARVFGIDTPIDSTQGKKAFQQLAQAMLDQRHPALYNQAIMDFGAVQCKPSGADCSSCPLHGMCAAYAQDKVSLYPVKEKKTRVRDRYFTYFYIHNSEGRIFLHRRDGKDIWQGLYEFFLKESDTPLVPSAVAQLFPGATINLRVSGFLHQLTHQRLHADLYEIDNIGSYRIQPDGLWIDEQDLHQYALPQLLVLLLQKMRRA